MTKDRDEAPWLPEAHRRTCPFSPGVDSTILPARNVQFSDSLCSEIHQVDGHLRRSEPAAGKYVTLVTGECYQKIYELHELLHRSLSEFNTVSFCDLSQNPSFVCQIFSEMACKHWPLINLQRTEVTYLPSK